MPNDYFQFKQFTVFQDRCAMKVCTDSCILGAYASVADHTKILDIGTGTGLLALMLAQRTTARIDAVEIHEDAFHQACDNISKSPWQSQIKVFQLPIQEFAQIPDKRQRYDFIISNPPFFSNHLLSPNKKRNLALHTQTLGLEELLEAVQRLLAENGEWLVLLPAYETTIIAALASAVGLRIKHQLIIKNREEGEVFRIITLFTNSKKEYSVTEAQLTIRDQGGSYTPAFRELLKDYYIIF